MTEMYRRIVMMKNKSELCYQSTTERKQIIFQHSKVDFQILSTVQNFQVCLPFTRKGTRKQSRIHLHAKGWKKLFYFSNMPVVHKAVWAIQINFFFIR